MITPCTGTAGIEPTPKVLETFVLPLNYVPKNGGKKWIRTTEPEGADLQSAAFSLFATLPYDFKKWRETESNSLHFISGFIKIRYNINITLRVIIDR